MVESLMATSRVSVTFTGTDTGQSAIMYPGGLPDRQAALQADLTSTGTVRAQGRSSDDAPWVNLGTGLTADGAETALPVFPQMRINVTANGSGVTAWLFAL